MKHFTYTPGTGGNFIACLLCHSKYNSQFKEIQNNEYGCETHFKHGVFSHYVTINPTVILHEPNKTYLFKKLVILLYKRYTSNTPLTADVRLAIDSLSYTGDYELQLARQLKEVTDFRYECTWSNLFYELDIDSWNYIFDFFKCNFNHSYLKLIEEYTRKNDKIFNSDETIRIREFLTKYT
jgi:hypothetical protein